MADEQTRALYDQLRAIRQDYGDLGRRLGQLEQSFAAALGDAPTATLAPTPPAGDTPATTEAAPAENEYRAPLILLDAGGGEQSEELYPNGIDGVIGMPLLRINAAAVVAMTRDEAYQIDPEIKQLHRKKIASYDPGSSTDPPLDVAVEAKKSLVTEHLGTIADIDQNKIQEAGWAVVIHAQEDVAVLKALWPLIEHRMIQMGFGKRDFDFQSGDTSCGAWLSRHTDGGARTFKDAIHWQPGQTPRWDEITVPPVLLVESGERVNAWLKRHGTSQAPVDPAQGVPFYLMIVGRPGPLDLSDQTFIPLNFQYELDMFWGVGRLAFTDEGGRHRIDDYRAYAERVVAWEQRPDAASRLRKELAFFGTRHEGDISTERSTEELVKPLLAWSQGGKIPVERQFEHTVSLGTDATKDNLARLLSASAPPALLFSATHGIGLPMSDPSRLVMNQGALLTADFAYGSIRPEHWLSGADLGAMSDLNVEGMIAVLFACYGIGCPQQDEFIFDANKQRRQIAPFPFISQLPQRMLVNGALAVLGHVERAWTYSFSGTEAGTTSQIQPFQDVLGRLMRGIPAGSATDQFNVIQGARSLTLTEELEYLLYDAKPKPQLARLWMARNDARNYLLLGDPAVRLAI
ncbi:hypothetical protein K2Z83_09595 [Oscillochloris sp. ZM17-4]|uniref:hypothetical protein n=1 Tax=Oscillochloris sp. ZM17-4 TaxID=2866714 RepID=UPI001C734C7A|nr:hypothetical protein [Oscillochloris sp. ZM17-4]MBX0327927.1 hypothetical protein [Oscillochloris sp. ZM17-4]